MSDLSWKPIESIKMGQEVLGYAFTKGERGNRWRAQKAKVTNIFHRKSEVVKLITTKGTTYCTPDHQWMIVKRGEKSYRHTYELSNKSIRFLSPPTPLRKRNAIIGKSLPNNKGAKVLSITPIGSMDVYNITTETGNYVANGLLSKNCYGGPNKPNLTLWNGEVEAWTLAFERLNRDIYFTLSYGEPMGSPGFYDVIDIIGKHDNWECCIITNLSFSPERLLESKLAKDKRVYVIGCFHPLGGADWEIFKKHILMLRDSDIKLMSMYLFYPPQIEWFKEYWKWFDANNIRTYVRRYIGKYEGKQYPFAYSPEVKQFMRAMTQPKTVKYGLDLTSPKGRLCTASKDMILVHHDGTIGLCADCPNNYICDANIFDPDFKLNDSMVYCPTNLCGGDYGMFHLIDGEFGDLPEKIWHDCFVAQTENITGGGREKVNYPKREAMEKWLLGKPRL